MAILKAKLMALALKNINLLIFVQRLVNQAIICKESHVFSYYETDHWHKNATEYCFYVYEVNA